METRIKVKLLPDAEWVDGVLTTGDPANSNGLPVPVVMIDGEPYEPAEVHLIRGMDQGAMTQGMLNKADDQGYAVDPIAF